MNVTEETTEGRLKKIARSTADQVAVQSDNVLWRLAAYIPGLNQLVARRERALAQQQCAMILSIVRALQKESPELNGEALYQKAVIRRLSCGEAKAREIIRLADQSFAQWPEERDVNFRDVVNYLVAKQIMSAHSRADGIRADVIKVVNAAVPNDL